jgi:hypothetical protein
MHTCMHTFMAEENCRSCTGVLYTYIHTYIHTCAHGRQGKTVEAVQEFGEGRETVLEVCIYMFSYVLVLHFAVNHMRLKSNYTQGGPTYIYIYIYMYYVYVYIHTYIHTHTHTHARTHAHTHACRITDTNTSCGWLCTLVSIICGSRVATLKAVLPDSTKQHRTNLEFSGSLSKLRTDIFHAFDM